MKKEFKLPELEENVESGTVAKVLVSEGDEVEEGQNVIELETEKAVVEVPVEMSGKVAEVRCEQGREIKSGDTVLVIETEAGEETAEPEREGGGRAAAFRNLCWRWFADWPGRPAPPITPPPGNLEGPPGTGWPAMVTATAGTGSTTGGTSAARTWPRANGAAAAPRTTTTWCLPTGTRPP